MKFDKTSILREGQKYDFNVKRCKKNADKVRNDLRIIEKSGRLS